VSTESRKGGAIGAGLGGGDLAGDLPLLLLGLLLLVPSAFEMETNRN